MTPEPALVEPMPEVLDVAPRSADRRLLLVLGVGVLVVALVLGGLAVADRVRGGASSPTALAERVTAALDEEDLGALVRLVDPGERSALQRLLSSWSARLVDLDLPAAVGGGTTTGRPLDGLDLTLSGTAPRLASTSGDLAVVDLPDLALRVRSTPADAHGALRAWFGYRHLSGPQDLTYPADALPGGLSARLVAVERSGRWYLSVVATLLGPGVSADSTTDVRTLDPVSSPSPQAAVEATVRALFAALERRDVVPFARTLDRSGSDAAQLWTSQVEAPALARDERLGELRTSAGPGDGVRATVRVDVLRVAGRSRLDLADGCASTGTERACLHRTGYRYAGGLGSTSLFDLLGRDGAFTLTAVRDSDGWRTSLPESLADALVGYADRLSRAQVLMLLGQERLDAPSGALLPDRASDVAFTDAGYALRTLRVGSAGLYRVVPSPTGSNRASLYDAEGRPDLQPFFPNDSVYRLAPGEHTLLVWADDAFVTSLDRGTPYVQRVEVRTVG